ncbi:MAG: MltA domain-containing protein [Planctomycetota bacterium]
MSRMLLLVAALSLLICLGCRQPDARLEPFQPQTDKDYGRPLPPGALALRKIDPAEYPDFSRGFHNRTGLEQAINYSLEYLAKPSSHKYFPYGDITHTRAVASLRRMRELLNDARSPRELDDAIRREFDVYQSVGCDDCGTVYFTGYYTPIFEGRLQRDQEFRYPLYALPPDLVKDEEGRTLGRQTSGGLEPYPTRRMIEEGHLLDGQEIAWLKDPFEAYVITVQGSAKLRLADGSLYELGYAGNNGHEYTAIAHRMIDAGVIGREELSLQSLLRFFKDHPEQVWHYCWQNDRYIFFQEAPGGPFGSLNTPVTPYHTIATDKEVFPRACPVFISTKLPRLYEGRVQNLPFTGFVLDQDTGGAIRAAGRCDVYMGIGPRAEAVAGHTGAEGALYYLFVRSGW